MGNVITKVGVTNCHFSSKVQVKRGCKKQPLSFMYVFIHIIFRIRNKVRNILGQAVLLLTENEATRDALLSIESTEVHHLVPKGFLSVR